MRKKCHSACISCEHVAEPGAARRLEPGADAEPAGHDLPGLGPAEHPRDRPQPVEPAAGVAAAWPAGSRCSASRAARPGWTARKYAGRSGSSTSVAVRRVRRVETTLHRRVPAGQLRPAAAAAAGAAADARSTAATVSSRFSRASAGSGYLSRDDLALLGELDLAVEHARGLGQDRVVRRPAAAPDRAAAAVEEPQPDAVPRRRTSRSARWAWWISHCDVVMPASLLESE